MESKKCKICQKRYAKQQEWKTEAEKEVCFTCCVFKSGLEQAISLVWDNTLEFL